MSAVESRLIAAPGARGTIFDEASGGSLDQSNQGDDFASVMQATLVPRGQKAPVQNSQRPENGLAANLSLSPKTGAPVGLSNGNTSKPESAIGQQNDTKGPGKSAATADDQSSPNTNAPSIVPDPQIPVPAFLSLPFFLTSPFPTPPTPPPKAATSGTNSQIQSLSSQATAANLTAPANTTYPNSLLTDSPILQPDGNAVLTKASPFYENLGLDVPAGNTGKSSSLPISNDVDSDATVPAPFVGMGDTAKTSSPNSDPGNLSSVDLTTLKMQADTQPVGLPASLNLSPNQAKKTSSIIPVSSESAKLQTHKLQVGGPEIADSTAKIAIQSDAEPVSAPIPLISNAENGPAVPTVKITGSNMALSPDLASQNGGTGVATMDSLMKNLQKTNKVAGSGVKVLPVEQNGQSGENNLPQSPAGPVRAIENRGVDLNLAFSNGNNQAQATDHTSTVNASDLPSLADARMRGLERTHDMMALHTMRLLESKSDTLSVVIKPSVGTELSLELHLDSDGVKAQATLTRGDHQFLNQHWPELQQRLEQRGVRLAPLGGEAGFFANDNSQFQKQQNSDDDAAQQASAFAEFAATTQTGGATARLAPVHDGWESWA